MMVINFSPFPILQTQRLILRRLDNSDAAEMLALRSDPQTMEFIPRPLLHTTEQVLEHIKTINDNIDANLGINWAISLRDNPKMIGIIGHYRIKPESYRAEIGYMLLPAYQGKGIITEAVQEVVKYGWNEMNLHSIEAIIDPRNYASAKVLEKNGFIKEGHLRENEFFDGRFWDSLIYSILKK